uniref:N-acylglucosamine-6-phosphate 2-epimerase n=1 Tax=Borrelia miyamotoi TaxID=47466 RepID=A0A482CZ82_9SPIR|nr:hypothetical protein EZU71_06760 [Borrelia miyamotoi]
MAKVPLVVKMGGTIGIRANGVLDINRIKLEVDLPIIGIIKKVYDNVPAFITRSIKEIDELCKDGVDVIDFDATFR